METQAESLFFSGVKSYNAGDFPAAVDFYQQSFALQDRPRTRHNLALALQADRRFPESLELYKSLQQYPRCQTGMAYCLNYAGRPGFWELLESRFQWALAPRGMMEMAGADKKYSGQSLHGKKLLFICEDGAGDSIQMIRYVPVIKSKFPKCKITVLAKPALHSLFRGVEGVEEVTGESQGFDFWLASFSAPLFFEAAGPAQFQVKPLFASRGGVGICWSGNPTQLEDRWRSLPSVELLRPLQACRQSIFNLQHDLICDWAINIEIKSFLRLARIIASLDVVVSVDTAVAHLSASLGVPTLLLLSWKCSDRWKCEGERSELYPSLHLIRQQKMNDWPPVIEAAATTIKHDRKETQEEEATAEGSDFHC